MSWRRRLAAKQFTCLRWGLMHATFLQLCGGRGCEIQGSLKGSHRADYLHHAARKCFPVALRWFVAATGCFQAHRLPRHNIVSCSAARQDVLIRR